MSIHEIQLLLWLLTGGIMLSLAWMVTYARDVILVLSHFLPLDPGEGPRLTSRKAVCTAITTFGFSLTAEIWVLVRAGSQL